jgi:hypothetical protein
MSDDLFFERLRRDAETLRYVPDQLALERLAAKIRERVHGQHSVSQLLAYWFRPMAASLAVVALAATVCLSWVGHSQDPVSVDQIAANATPATSDSDSYSVGE